MANDGEEVDDDVSEEIMHLSTLKFAPLDHTHLTAPLTTPQPPRTASSQKSPTTLLESQLRTLVDAHEQSLLDGVGDVRILRKHLLATMTDLRTTHDATLSRHREEVVVQLSLREDANHVSEKISALKDAEAGVLEQLDDHRLRLSRIDEELETLRGRIRQLTDERRVLDRDAGEARRKEELARVRSEVRDLQRRPTTEACTASIRALNEAIDVDTTHVTALSRGAELFMKVMGKLDQYESLVREALRRHDEAAVRGQLDEAVGYLTQQVEEVQRHGWNLLVAVLSAEREAYLGAREMMGHGDDESVQSARENGQQET